MSIEQLQNIHKKETTNNIENLPLPEILKYTNESQAAYLHRAEELVTEELKKEKGLLFDPSRSLEENLSPKIIALIDDIVKNAASSHCEDSIEHQNINEVLKEVRNKIGGHSKLQDSEFNSDNFDTTQRGRKFFEIQPGKGSAKRETYWNTLFF